MVVAYTRVFSTLELLFKQHSHLQVKCEERSERATFRKNKGTINAKRGYTFRKNKMNADVMEIGAHAGLSQYSKNSPPRTVE